MTTIYCSINGAPCRKRKYFTTKGAQKAFDRMARKHHEKNISAAHINTGTGEIILTHEGQLEWLYD